MAETQDMLTHSSSEIVYFFPSHLFSSNIWILSRRQLTPGDSLD